MADFETKIENITFEEDSRKFCQATYDAAEKENDSLSPSVIADRAFYECVDPILDKRAADKKVIRSHQFVPEIQSGIETRLSVVIDKGQEDSPLIRFNLKEGNEDDVEIQKAVDSKEIELQEQFETCGFLFDGFSDFFMAAEMQPMSVVKISQEEKYGYVAKRVDPIQRLLQRGIDVLKYLWDSLLGERPKSLQVRTEYVWELISRQPIVKWLDWNEFLWAPGGGSVLQEKPYCIHRRYMSWNDVVEDSKRLGYDEREMEAMKDNAQSGGDTADSSTTEKVDEKVSRARAPKEYMRENNYLICEHWIKTRDKKGREIVKLVVMGNNEFELKKMDSPYKTITFPFVIRVAWPILGKIYGNSTIEVGKTLQRLHNDAHNTILDAATYGIFAPMFMESSVHILEEPVYGPASIIRVNKVDGVKNMELNLGPIDLMPALSDAYGAKLRQRINAPDVQQSIESKADDTEKATKVRIRVQASMRRLRPLFESVKTNLVEIADMFIKINQIDDTEWILPVTLDVPALSGVTTPDEERMNALLIYEQAKENPLYQSPEGLLKLRQLWVDFLGKSRIRDIDNRCLKEEELNMIIQQQIAEQKAAELQEQVNGKENQGASPGRARVA